MADYRYFKCKFWADPYIQELLPEEKLLYIYLFTNEHGNQAGMYPITLRTIVFESGIESENLKTILAKFRGDGKCIYQNKIMWVKNFVRHQANKSPKVRKRIATDLEELTDCNLIGQFLKYNDTLSIPYQYPINTSTTEYSTVQAEVEVEESTKEVQASDELSTFSESYPHSSLLAGLPTSIFNKEYPNFTVIWTWWTDETQGKLLASAKKKDAQKLAIIREIERIGSQLGTWKMIEAAQKDYQSKPPSKKPQTLNYYLPMWRDLPKTDSKSDADLDSQKKERRTGEFRQPDADPAHISNALEVLPDWSEDEAIQAKRMQEKQGDQHDEI